jgi:AcrR family transcriptional regulator
LIESKRERTKQANREAILRAAREVFSELGYGASSVRDIVRRTDLASGTFYNYFPDKEAVFRALVDETARVAAERTHLARRSAATLEDFLALGFRAYFELLLADRATFELAVRMLEDDAPDVERAVAFCTKLFAGGLAHLR